MTPCVCLCYRKGGPSLTGWPGIFDVTTLMMTLLRRGGVGGGIERGSGGLSVRERTPGDHACSCLKL